MSNHENNSRNDFVELKLHENEVLHSLMGKKLNIPEILHPEGGHFEFQGHMKVIG